MLLFKKKYVSYLYIYFLILVFFFNEFSTNIAFSRNYKVSNVKVEEVYDINFDKSKVIDKAFEQAFRVLFYKLTENNSEMILVDLHKKMIEYADNLDFENAAKVRDEIENIQKSLKV